jgi:hypothetical protein
MSHALTLISLGEKRHFKTDFCLDMDVRQIFEDLLSFRNINHWDEMDLENFLATEGRIVSEYITLLPSDKNETILAALGSEKFKNTGKIIVCVYSHSTMSVAGYGKILEQIGAAVPAETRILSGWICDEKTYQNGVTINLIAVCME